MKSGTLREKLINGFAGATMLAAASVAGVSGAANAQDVPAQPVVTTDECQLSSQEICDLHEASNAAHDYALANPGVGILIHVGQDFPNEHFQNADQFGQAFVNAFAQQDVEARYFLSPNDAPNTVMTFYLGPYIHGQHNGTEVKNVLEAMNAIPEVSQQLRIMNGVASAPGVAGPSGG